jgi:hypothetical protein
MLKAQISAESLQSDGQTNETELSREMRFLNGWGQAECITFSSAGHAR